MGIESTQTIKRTDAIAMLAYKGIRVYGSESLDRLAYLIYENRETIFENYCVFEDKDIDENEWTKTWW